MAGRRDTARVYRENSTVQSKRATTNANLKNDNAEITSAQMSDVACHKKRVVTSRCLRYPFHVPHREIPTSVATCGDAVLVPVPVPRETTSFSRR